MKYESPYTPSFSKRDPNPNVDKIFSQRWSPRSFVKTELGPEDLSTIFDAARWAPSAYNEQPWRFLTSTPDTFDAFLNLLAEPNQKWAKNASLLGFMLAKKTFTHNDQPNHWAAYDCGAAWMSMTLQARMLGLYTHGMAGIKVNEIVDSFIINTREFDVLAGFAIGVLDIRKRLEEPYIDWEEPSARKHLTEIWRQGRW